MINEKASAVFERGKAWSKARPVLGIAVLLVVLMLASAAVCFGWEMGFDLALFIRRIWIR